MGIKVLTLGEIHSKRFCFCVVAFCFYRLQHRRRTDKANKYHSEPELSNLRLSISVFYTSRGEDKGEMIAKRRGIWYTNFKSSSNDP